MIYTDRKHITADTLKELNDFGIKLELELSSKGVHVHYKVNEEQIVRVIAEGAKVVSTQEIIELAEKMEVL